MADQKQAQQTQQAQVPAKPKMVEYVTIRDRYVRGEYVRASPEAPATILLPEGCPENATIWRKREAKDAEPLGLQPHFNAANKGGAPAAHTHDQTGGRASDREPTR